MAWKRDSEYWKARVQNERPEIWAEVESGKITSVRAAAIKCGFIRERTALMDLKRAWKKASASERKTFMAEVSG